MKIITNNAVYIQKNDIAYLNHTDLPMPATIFMKIFGSGVVVINDSNRYDFVKFEKQSEIDFFKNLDWIIDYNEVKDLSEEETISLGQSIADEKNRIAKKFNSMSQKERYNNKNMVTQCELLDFKIYSLRDVLWFKQGHVSMTLPNGIDYPDGYNQEKGIKKVLKRIFKK